MRIVFFHSELGILAGGGENFTRQLIAQLVCRGHEVAAIYVARADGTVPLSVPSGIQSLPLPGYWNRTLGQTTLSMLGSSLYISSKFPQFWVRIQLAAAWRAAYWHNWRFRRQALKLMRGRWTDYEAAYVHNDPPLAFEVARFLPTCLRLVGQMGKDHAGYLDRVQTVCANGDVLRQLKGVSYIKRPIEELPIGLDTSHFCPDGPNFRRELGWGPESVVLGYVGRMTVLKGVRLLFEAFLKISDRCPETRLLLIGDGEEISAIERAVIRNRLQERVRLLGIQQTETLPKWYRSMDVFVMPSRYENFSNALLEAMGCGVPVIASNVGGNNHLVMHASNGFLFESGKLQHLCEMLSLFVHYRHKWNDFSRACRSIVQSTFSWDKTAATLESFFCQMRRRD